MGSTWRAVADPTVGFRYNVTPMMTGSLLDMTFDGPSAITMRGGTEPPQHYVGSAATEPGDPAAMTVYAGGKPEFLALTPWVAPDTSRDELTKIGTDLAAGSGSQNENGYLESAVWADLVSTP
jgi:hypothetical protein